jgi:hypothetical protein
MSSDTHHPYRHHKVWSICHCQEHPNIGCSIYLVSSTKIATVNWYSVIRHMGSCLYLQSTEISSKMWTPPEFRVDCRSKQTSSQIPLILFAPAAPLPVSCCLYRMSSSSLCFIFDIHRTVHRDIFLQYKPMRCTISQICFGKELRTFRTDLLSIIISLNTAYAALGICHANYIDCLLADPDPASRQST